MSHYIDGFVHPIPFDRLEEYKRLVVAIAEIWKEHGALDYWECVFDNLEFEGTKSFKDLVTSSEEETVLFGWLVFESRESRDQVHKDVAADPRMEALMNESDTGFDASRMVFGGFKPFVPV